MPQFSSARDVAHRLDLPVRWIPDLRIIDLEDIRPVLSDLKNRLPFFRPRKI